MQAMPREAESKRPFPERIYPKVRFTSESD